MHVTAEYSFILEKFLYSCSLVILYYDYLALTYTYWGMWSFFQSAEKKQAQGATQSPQICAIFPAHNSRTGAQVSSNRRRSSRQYGECTDWYPCTPATVYNKPLGIVYLCSTCSCYDECTGWYPYSRPVTVNTVARYSWSVPHQYSLLLRCFCSQERKSKILNMQQLQPDSEFQKCLKDCNRKENCK